MNVNATAAKLLIQPVARLWFSPIEWLWMLGPLPPGVAVVPEFASATVAVIYVSNAQSVRWFFDQHRTVLATVPVVWVCYLTRGRPDFNRGSLVSLAAAHGQHPVSEVPLDTEWTAMRLRPLGARV